MLTGRKICCGNAFFLNEFATGWRSYGVGVGNSKRDPNLLVQEGAGRGSACIYLVNPYKPLLITGRDPA